MYFWKPLKNWHGISVTLTGDLHNKYAQCQCLGSTQVRKQSLRFLFMQKTGERAGSEIPVIVLLLALEDAFCKQQQHFCPTRWQSYYISHIRHHRAMRKSVPKITLVPMVKSSIKQNWNQQVLQSRGHLNSSLGRHRPSQSNLMLHFDSSASTPHHIPTQKKTRLFTGSRKKMHFLGLKKMPFTW